MNQNPKDKYLAPLSGLGEFLPGFAHIHPFLSKLYPVAIVEEMDFWVYVPDGDRYRYEATIQTGLEVPPGVRAALPLEALDHQMVCLVTPEIFEEADGFVTIFHEFVHCQQFEQGEMAMKEGLEVYQTALEKYDYMWEINHPFPYGDPAFVELYPGMVHAASTGDLQETMALRASLRGKLARPDYEYMVWQEYKEGLARYLENHMRAGVGLPLNYNGSNPPYSRVSFYAGGAALISAFHNSGISPTYEGVLEDPARLFNILLRGVD